MRLQSFAFLCLFAVSYVTNAENLLFPPVAQPVQCNQVYESVSGPKTLDNVLSSMDRVCHNNGGLQVLHQELTTQVIMSCTGDNPSAKIFACLFSVTSQRMRN